ncbi:MAG: septal ring lytic transglycosylase RlpA family protein [Actinomycetota bacterium]|nr:septal ring lytic transglycosylase RlpA family protein [Actinomycetota bacterium]
MRRFRIRRRRVFALALAPVIALTITTPTASSQETSEATIYGQDLVTFGNYIKLRGQFPGASGATLAVEYRAPGTDAFRGVTQALTDSDGRWSRRVKPTGSGVWRGRLIETQPQEGVMFSGEAPSVDTTTDGKTVRVRSVTNLRVTDRHTLIGEGVRIKGRVKPDGRRRVRVIAGGKTMRTRANRRGRFHVNWNPRSLGSHRIRAIAASNRSATWSKDRAGRVTVYRYAYASWYGPGFYGNRTACGQTLTSSTVGVAHKSLPCGTKVTFRHSGNTVTAPVIDRGPYIAGREYDLTSALRSKLGFGSTGYLMSTR